MIEGAVGKWGAIAVASVVVAALLAWAIYRRVRERRSH